VAGAVYVSFALVWVAGMDLKMGKIKTHSAPAGGRYGSAIQLHRTIAKVVSSTTRA
jgi:hypothetical protein